MEFKIKKEVEIHGTWYWTIPRNLFLRLIHVYLALFMEFYYIGKQTPYDCWQTKKEAIQHIERWNSGYYKKKYYSKYLKD